MPDRAPSKSELKVTNVRAHMILFKTTTGRCMADSTVFLNLDAKINKWGAQALHPETLTALYTQDGKSLPDSLLQ